MSQTAETLIAQVRNIVIYDLDLPTATPDTGIADTEILGMLNIASDELARKLSLYDPAVSFTFTSSNGRSVAYDDSTVFSRRVYQIIEMWLSDGTSIELKPVSLYNPTNPITGSLSRAYLDDDRLYLEPPIAANTTGYVQANWLPKPLTLGSGLNSELPNQIVDRHLARYTIATNASVFDTEGQQVSRTNSMKMDALQAVTDFVNVRKANRSSFNRDSGRYRI